MKNGTHARTSEAVQVGRQRRTALLAILPGTDAAILLRAYSPVSKAVNTITKPAFTATRSREQRGLREPCAV